MRAYWLLALLALAAFGASLAHGFHFDDASLLVNPAITAPHGWRSVLTLSQTRPLTWLTFWLNYQSTGSSPMPWHAVNLMLHVANVCLVFRAATLVCLRRAAFLAAALFAIHPIQAESAAYVFSRSSELCTLFCLLSLLAWEHARRWLAVLLFALALLSKEECVAFPLFLILLDGARKRRLTGIPWVGGMLALSLAAGIRVLYATKALASTGAGFSSGVSPFTYLLSQGFAILRYFWLLVVPWGFTIDPELPQPTPLLLGCWLLLGLFVALVWKHRHASAATYWFLGGLVLLLPSSSIFPAADFAADHRLYLPLVAFAIASGLLLQNANRWALGACFAALLLISWSRMQVWSSDRALWAEAAGRAPHKTRPLIQLARVSDPPEALALLGRARELAPDDPNVAAETGRLYLANRMPARALGEFGRALALTPNDPHALNNRGAALQSLGQTAAARADFLRALQISPCLEEARRNLGWAPCPAPTER